MAISEIPVIFGAGLILLLLFITGYMGLRIKVPGLVIYILLGVVLGSLLADHQLLKIAGEIGVIILFFMLGMEFPIKRLTGIAKKVAPAGFLDVFLSLGVSMGICYLFGLDIVTSFLIGGVLYATSSSITAKLLQSTKRMANRESEFMLGLLIFEDLAAPIAVAVLVGLTAGSSITGPDFGLLIFKIILLTLGAIVIGRFVFTKLGPFFDRYINEDFIILFVVGMAISYGGLALYLDLSEVLGAFLAGIIIAEVRRSDELEHVLLPVRDLLLPLFFLYFGTSIALGESVPHIGLLIILFFWSIIAKLLVGILGGRAYGLTSKVALRAGLSLTQRGEFSVIIASLALAPIKLFAGIFILLSALTGIFLFQFAPKITNKIYGDKKDKRKLEVPS